MPFRMRTMRTLAAGQPPQAAAQLHKVGARARVATPWLNRPLRGTQLFSTHPPYLRAAPSRSQATEAVSENREADGPVKGTDSEVAARSSDTCVFMSEAVHHAVGRTGS